MEAGSAILEILISTIALGSLYCVMSMGLTLTFSTLQLFNFSHGTLIMCGAYLMWFFLNSVNLNFPISVILAVLGTVMISLVIERTVLKGLMKKEPIEIIIGTLAVALLLQNVVLLSFGGRLKRVPLLVEGGANIGGAFIAYNNILIGVVSVLILLGLLSFLKGTKYGMAMRAIAQDKDASKVLGINISAMNMLIFTISGGLAGIAGVFLGSIYMINPAMGDEALTKAFIICVVGGLGNIPGTIVASYMVSFIEITSSFVLGIYWAPLVLAAFMLVTILACPVGLFGRGER